MGIGHPPRKKQDRPGADNVVSLRHLDEAATSKDAESPRRGFPDVLSLAEENARLRALAVGLSNLLGDLPVREWEDAARSHCNET